MNSVILRDSDILGGVPVFQETRVPIKNLFDCREQGYTVGELSEYFPSVSEAQVRWLLEKLNEGEGLTKL